MAETAKNLKVIKVGTYRKIFMFLALSLIIFYAVSLNTIVFSAITVIGFGWVIFELNVVLQAIMGVQRMMIFTMQPKQGNEVRTDEEASTKA